MSEKKKPTKKATTGTNTTGQQTPKDWGSLNKPLSPDHPIFKSGYVIGGYYGRRRPSKKDDAER